MRNGPCLLHCPSEGGGGFLAALGVLAAAAVAVAVVSWLAGAWPVVLAVMVSVAAGAALAGWLVSVVSRWLARLAVVSWPSRGWRESPAVLRARLELAAPPPAIEARRPVVATVLSRHDERVRRGLQ